ncbi:Delta-1-pyrroline-5-carboxylate dehydrogenase, mitochondrial [Nymphon striatum]|nr:Delta-1-pyrroline-5-carboxylate dehydrogenase, mitochondrial [Nymphon striatum]
MLEYLKGSKERKELEAALNKYSNQVTDVPIIIGSNEIKSGQTRDQVMPFNHSKKLATFQLASADHIKQAIKVSQEARISWEARPISERIDIFLKVADLITGKYHMDLMAATMLGQGKTVVQAEIDAIAEMADFFRFNAFFAKEILKYQPISIPNVTNNSIRYRGIEGFIAAISPFNFTAIGGNLASAPTLMGNVTLWKPSDTSMLANYITFKIFQEAGFPEGVINFLPADGPVFGDTITQDEHLAGINFTGSVPTFRHLWQQVGQNLHTYKNFPRLVGECGGKNYHFIHQSADVDSVVMGTIRSAFEYGGQKCSACSRMYVPDNLWPKIKEQLLSEHKNVKLGSPLEYDSFFSAIIDEKSFVRNKDYIDYAKNSPNMKILAGGNYDDSKGYYIEPTIIETTDPNEKLMKEEIFGPILTVCTYPANDYKKYLTVANESTPYALTGAIFGKDSKFVEEATELMKMSAGNFYINDKSTGSVVGQQPFGGGRLSGTNDKAGGPHYMLKWASPQCIKETMVPLTQWKYPYMEN